MKHPDQATLALYAGGDLGRLEAWRTALHVARCGVCREKVAAYGDMRKQLPEIDRLPEVQWDRLAGEMRANIRLGLAAGECVREFEEEAVRPWLFNGARAAIALGSILALLVTGIVLRRATPSLMSAAVPVVQPVDYGIERRAGDTGFAMLHKNVKDVAYSVGAQGTMGASYVDPSTGYVTMTKVYVE